jgi:hypothetical protein
LVLRYVVLSGDGDDDQTLLCHGGEDQIHLYGDGCDAQMSPCDSGPCGDDDCESLPYDHHFGCSLSSPVVTSLMLRTILTMVRI